MLRLILIATLVIWAGFSQKSYGKEINDFKKLLEKGIESMKKAEHEKAVNYFKKAISIEPDNYNGYLVSLNSPIQIVEKLYEITKNYNNYLSMSKNARNLCEKNFDEEIILSKYEKKLDYILN